MPDKPENRAYTSFSFQRFTIPAWREFQGRAIYMDSDMLVLGDVKELIGTPMRGKDLLTVGGSRDHFSVLLLDCERLGLKQWSIDKIIQRMDEGEFFYRDLMFGMPIANWSPTLPARWNCLDEHPPDAALLHYTRLMTQPWLTVDHPLAHLWVSELLDAVSAGDVTHQQLQQHVDLKHVRPSLLHQVELSQPNCRKIPTKILDGDKKFLHHCDKHRFVLP